MIPAIHEALGWWHGWLPKPEGGKNDDSDLVKYGMANWYRTKPKILDALKRARLQAERAEAAKQTEKKS